jgi:hypothetical protein
MAPEIIERLRGASGDQHTGRHSLQPFPHDAPFERATFRRRSTGGADELDVENALLHPTSVPDQPSGHEPCVRSGGSASRSLRCGGKADHTVRVKAPRRSTARLTQTLRAIAVSH